MDMGIDIDHYPRAITAVCCQNSFTAEIAVFLQHIHSLTEVGCILEQRTAAEFVQIILPDVGYVLGSYLVEYPLSLDRAEVNVTETVSVDSLFTEILAYLNSVAERIKCYTVLHGLNTVQCTLDTVNDTAQSEQFAVIFAAPVLAESHIRDEVRFDEVVVVINELPVCLCIEMQIQLLFIVVCELSSEELIHKVLVVFSDLLWHSLRIVLA